MPESIECEFDSCDWKSAEGNLADVIRLYELHVKARHNSTQNAPRVEKAKRPELAAELSDEDWAYFLVRWADYKKATGISGTDIITQLMEILK